MESEVQTLVVVLIGWQNTKKNDTMKIREYVKNIKSYPADKTYQRPEGVWSKEDQQCLIDTILRGEPMPLFLNAVEDKFYVVDGQQRLFCVKEFYNDKFKLNEKFSGKELANKKFSELGVKLQDDFLEYDLNTHILENYDDERVRMIFSKLQRGQRLTDGEKINALPGEIIISIRKMAEHKFFKDSIDMKTKRYQNFIIIARMFFIEKYGNKDYNNKNIYNFLSENKDLDYKNEIFKKTKSVLSYLYRCFPDGSPLDSQAWILAVYSLISDIMSNYVLTNQENNINKFIKEFYNKVRKEDFRHSNIDYQRFFENIRGGFTEKIVKLRFEILKKYFFKSNYFKLKDPNRQISINDKKNAYARSNGKCENCNKNIKNYKEAEYHHIIRHTDGGSTELGNIKVLCKSCHKKIHFNNNKKNLNFSEQEYYKDYNEIDD